MANVTKIGKTTMQWGTEGVLPGYTTALVDSIKTSDKGDVIEEAGNDGRTAAIIAVDDGWEADISCVDDTGITWPVKGATVQIKRARDAAAKTCVVTGVSDEASRKATGKITFKVRYAPALVV